MKEHDDYIINKILALGKRDILYVIGDFLFDGDHYEEYIERLSKKNCRIKVVMGNHDSLRLYSEPKELFEIQLALYQKKNIWISHAPIHPCEMRDRLGNVHGHLHLEKVQKDIYMRSMTDRDGEMFGNPVQVQDLRYFNVNLDVNNYEFVDWEDIKQHFQNLEI